MKPTLAYPYVRTFADDWENLYPSAVCSGIAPDRAHVLRGGYHVCRAANPARNYSVVRKDDRGGCGPDDASAAVDMTMNRRDMILATKRMLAIYHNRADPRRKYLNAVNGWLGSGNAIRIDFVANTITEASPDHTWHMHLEIRRRYVKVRAAFTAILSGLAGDTVAQYLKKIGVSVTVAKPAAATATAKGPSVPGYPGRVLQRTDSNRPDPAVKTWQARMIARGWKSIGTADGKFGAKTERVVRRFQRVCRIEVDGHIGPQTWPKPWTQPLGSAAGEK